MTRKEFVQIATSIIGALSLVLVAFGVLRQDAQRAQFVDIPQIEGLAGAGVSSFDRLSLDGTTDPVLDLTGNCADFDDDGDTSLCADTDDQIDVEVSGADDFQFTANTFSALSGSTIEANNVSEETAASGVTVDDELILSDDLRVSAQTSITATNGNPITATGTYQPITAAGAVTPTLAAGTAGDVLVLINTAAQDILIQDTGNQVLAGNVTLNQYDSITLWADGTRWIEISRSNN